MSSIEINNILQGESTLTNPEFFFFVNSFETKNMVINIDSLQSNIEYPEEFVKIHV